MCGIVAIFNSTAKKEDLRKLIVALAKLIRHRGPDWSGIRLVAGGGAIAHERLAIVDPESGSQPLEMTVPHPTAADPSGTALITLAVNGEIYNHLDLAKELTQPYAFQTKSDCEILLPLYLEQGPLFVSRLRGMFGFVMQDGRTGEYMAARDHLGIIPLYIGWSADGAVCIASELKAIAARCIRFEVFPPGTVYTSKEGKFTKWYNPGYSLEVIPTTPCPVETIRVALTESVRRRMMADVPWGLLLSGGLDSSLVASIAVRILRDDARAAAQRPVSPGGSQPRLAWGGNIHSFCIGLEGSPDLAAAKKVADYLGTTHHTFKFTLEEGLDAISDVIYSLETYDTTTIRAATPMFLMSRKIKALGVKMVLSGEGADEIFGGYMYFHKAPSAAELHRETVRKLGELHTFDCLRANKATAAWGVEARVPFLDLDFLEVAMGMDPSLKLCTDASGSPRMEKWILRKAFDTPEDPYLPHDVLWRQKEQFSDGVGYSWIDSLRDLAERDVSDSAFKQAAFLFPHNTPRTKENYLYRSIFMQHYPQHAAQLTVPGGPSVACSSAAAVRWSKEFEKLVEEAAGDCSGRAVSNHNHAYEDAVAVATGSKSKLAMLQKQQLDEEASVAKRKQSEDGPQGSGKRAKEGE